MQNSDNSSYLSWQVVYEQLRIAREHTVRFATLAQQQKTDELKQAYLNEAAKWAQKGILAQTIIQQIFSSKHIN